MHDGSIDAVVMREGEGVDVERGVGGDKDRGVSREGIRRTTEVRTTAGCCVI